MTALSALIFEVLDLMEDETPDQYRDRTGRCPRGYRFSQDSQKCSTKDSASKTPGGGAETESKPPFSVSSAEIDAMEKHVKDFVKVLGLNPVDHYKRTALIHQAQRDAFEEMPEESQLLASIARAASQQFERSVVKNHKLHEDLTVAWAESTSEDLSQQLQGSLSAIGVEGQAAPGETSAGLRDQGAKNSEMREWVKEVQAFTQAVLKHYGISELTVYRGVKDQLDDAEKGDEIGLDCREASSFSLAPSQARRFSNTVVAMRIPASRVLLSAVSSSELNALAEHEVVVMGASALKGILV